MNHRILYVTSIVVLVVLAGIALFSFAGNQQDARADEKAQQLITELNAAGLRAPQPEQIARVLGDDGGAVCDEPDDSLRRGILYGQLTNGAGGPGLRPVIADNNVVQGQLLIIKVYCPQYLDAFQRVVDDLKLEEVA
ncbi:hypothetical protein [Actinoplanes sp. GCM10030250]|uniref:hypothetical protein n=1 Tax=Actinoplanes sp. GCM10030250 TaxID=3273376 RepID=UPI0036710F3B